MIDFQEFCDDYNVDYAKSGKHFRPSWVNLQCPFCSGHAGYHLGVEIQKGYGNCHRCGHHSLVDIIKRLTGVNYNTAKDLLKKYSTGTAPLRQQKRQINVPSEIIFPADTKKLTQKARNYLIGRNFDPDKLANIWNLYSTSHIGFYKNRILAPIYQKNQLVSYQTRDVTGKASQKYLACFQDEEIIQHQKCLYGLDLVPGKTCIVVEGITDVWRMGIGAIGVFGISFTKQQARLIAQSFNRVFIMFDSEDQAQEKAEELGFLISSAFNNPVEVINLPFIVPDIDPGELPQDDADNIMKEIGL